MTTFVQGSMSRVCLVQATKTVHDDLCQFYIKEHSLHGEAWAKWPIFDKRHDKMYVSRKEMLYF